MSYSDKDFQAAIDAFHAENDKSLVPYRQMIGRGTRKSPIPIIAHDPGNWRFELTRKKSVGLTGLDSEERAALERARQETMAKRVATRPARKLREALGAIRADFDGFLLRFYRPIMLTLGLFLVIVAAINFAEVLAP